MFQSFNQLKVFQLVKLLPVVLSSQRNYCRFFADILENFINEFFVIQLYYTMIPLKVLSPNKANQEVRILCIYNFLTEQTSQDVHNICSQH